MPAGIKANLPKLLSKEPKEKPERISKKKSAGREIVAFPTRQELPGF
jgi:hypothetical protein